MGNEKGTCGDRQRTCHMGIEFMGKRTYIRRVGAVLACLILTIELVCTSYTRVQAAEVVAGYTIEQIVGALLVSLGITSATGEALDKAGLTGTDATKILNSIYASAKEFSHDTDEMIDQTIMGAIADATETGKIIFKEGSKAWDAIKDWAVGFYNGIKGLAKPETDGALSTYYDLTSLYGIYPYTDFYSYLSAVVRDMYAEVGVNAFSNDLTDSSAKFFCQSDIKQAYYILFTTCYSGKYVVSGVYATSYSQFLELQEWLQTTLVNNDSAAFFTRSVWGFEVDHGYTDYNTYRFGQLTDMRLLNLSEAQLLQKYHVGDVAFDDAYDMVYNPAIDDIFDIATPTNTITEEKDGTRTIAGDRTIDVALPIAWPVDLTKGIVIGKDTPIEDVLDRTKTDEKTDDKKDDKKEEEDKPPITPDLPSGAVGDNLEADLKSIFPFCIPFDLIACIKGLAADPEAPVWNIKIPMPWVKYTWTITVDMGDYESVVKIFRIGEDLLFIVGLIVVTRNLIRG